MPTVNRLARPTSLVRGFYVLLAAAVLLEAVFPAVAYPDDLGRFVPFFEDVSSWTHVKGLSFSLGELFMLVMLVLTLLRVSSSRSIRFDKGSLMRPLGFYMLMVAVAEVNGLATGGDFRLSLWEIRPQIYLFVAYILACNLVTTRKQINTLLWIMLVGTGIKGVQGVYRYLISLHGNIHSVESLFPHEQSFFFNNYITLMAILFLYGGSRRMKRVALFLLPFVAVASLANQRRAAVVALGVALLSLLLVTAVAYPARRRAVAMIVLALAVIFPPYYLAFKNSTGLTGEVAHAIASATSPDPRDASSNLYRINEDKDILATMRTSPIIGYGFGKPMQTPYALADISSTYLFWNIMPHDSILWVWMRLGTIGYLLLWVMIGTIIVQMSRLASRLDDPFLKGLAVWVLLLAVQQIIFGYLDLQWENYRNMIVLGFAFALPSRLALLAAADERAKDGATGAINPPVKIRRTPYIPPSLAVVDGRLTTRHPSPSWRRRRAG